jgi:hypothetical protein
VAGVLVQAGYAISTAIAVRPSFSATYCKPMSFSFLDIRASVTAGLPLTIKFILTHCTLEPTTVKYLF